ncbi:hypothetical protein AB4Z09_13600 [Rhodococcus sp. TAF43]|uniref:hypothetical protein n=1 Tax=Rhodococcus sp. TAF43 TaxID=3237483 RepID=UPI003F94A171
MTNSDVPATFAATVTVVGEADRISTDTGGCGVGTASVAPGDRVVILGDSGSAYAASALAVESIDQRPDGTRSCTYTAHFDAVPANQRNYVLWMNNFTEQSVTSDELDNGATYRLHTSASGTGTNPQDEDGTR